MNAAVDTGGSGSPMPRLSDSQLREVMRLMKGSHSVELKISVPASAHRATIQGLPMDPVEAQPRQIYFFDTPDLQLYRAGVVVRARRIAGGRGDTVIKLRPVEPDEIPTDLKNDPSFNIEVDALPGGFVCSASFRGRSTGQAIRDAVNGKRKLSRLFSKPQRAFYRLHAPMGIDIDSLVPLGPTFILKDRFDTQMGLDGKSVRSMVAEVWLYPDGSRILELSTKCLPNDALGAAAELRAYLIDKGVPTNAAQETKTRTALEFYSKALLAEMAAEKAEERRAERRTPRKPAVAKSAAKPAVAKTAAKLAAKPKAAAKAAVRAATKAAAKPKAAAKAKVPGKAATKAAATKPAAKPAAAKAAVKAQAPTTAATTAAPTKTAAKPAAAKSAAAKPAAAKSTARTTARRTATRRAPARSAGRRTPPKQS